MVRSFYLILATAIGLVIPVPSHSRNFPRIVHGDVSYPAPVGVWGSHEYTIIDAILRTGSVDAYPRLTSEATRPVFLKMIDAGNVAAVHDRSVPLLRRLIDLRSYDGYIGCIRARYNIHTRLGAPLQAELVLLQAFLLDLSALTVEMTEPFLVSLESNERQQLQQMNFFDTFATLKNHVAGVVTSLSETTVYSTAQRRELTEAIGRTFPAMRGLFTTLEREQTAAELLRLARSTGDPNLRRALTATARIVAVD